MFGWLHRKAIEKTAVPECSDKAVDAWMRRQNGAEKLRKDYGMEEDGEEEKQ